MCNNKVPCEGIVIRVEGLDLNVFKLKSDNFFLKETEQLDSEESYIEE